MTEATEKTEQQLGQEIAALVQEIGTRTYTRWLVDREVAQLQARLYDANVELHNRRKARAALEAELAAEKAAVEAAPEAEARHE